MYKLTESQKEFLEKVIPKYFDKNPPDYDRFWDNDYFRGENYKYKKDFFNFFNDAGLNALDYMTYIPENMCSNNNIIKNIIIPHNIAYIYDEAFSDCTNLESVEIENGLKTIKDVVFYDCKKLKNIVLPDTLESIGDYVFEGCSSLEKVIIPYNIENLGICIFKGCESLKELVMPYRYIGKNIESYLEIDTSKTKVKFI